MFNIYKSPLKKPLIFITGTPRSGTSLVTKVVDTHPNIACLMENIFGNRRRHWKKAKFWNSTTKLKKKVAKAYSKLKEPIVGNKVATPDVWAADDINLFCSLFKDFKIVFVIRDPVAVSLSRFKRENYQREYNKKAKKNSLLNFKSRALTYISSWRQNIENYRKLKEAHPSKVYLLYYEDFCENFEKEVKSLCKFLDIPFAKEMKNWHKYPHHDKRGKLKRNLKYPDKPIFVKKINYDKAPKETIKALKNIPIYYKYWKERKIHTL